MEPQLAADGINIVPGEGGNLQQGLDMMGAESGSLWNAQSLQKRKRNQVTQDVMDEDSPFKAVLPVEAGTSGKNKQLMEVDEVSESKTKDAVTDLIGSSTYPYLENGASFDPDNPEADADDYQYPNYQEYDYYVYEFEDENEEYDYDDGTATDVIDNYENLAAKFDGLDLPPGVEATVPWLPNLSSVTSSRTNTFIGGEIEKKYNLFKQFDTIQDCPDHFYLKKEAVTKKPSKDWVKQIQHEWKVLKKDLPETIFVRVYEDRMDLLRAAIIGPAGTPYHDGLFFFDIYFPSNYPNVPPLVHYHSGGLRLNPNLYNCGKVCLSLLGTWSGSGCERWSPGKSTMLQVLVSIQGLVLNEKPYFNEPGYAKDAGTQSGEKLSLAYNEDAFLLSCKTMLYSLRKPPMNFEDLVYGHFRKHGRTILIACLSYLNGAWIGSALPDEIPDVYLSDDRTLFQQSLRKLYEDLLMEFTVKDADCDGFLAKKIKPKTPKPDEDSWKFGPQS